MIGRKRWRGAVTMTVILVGACADDAATNADDTTGETSTSTDPTPTTSSSSSTDPPPTTSSPDTSGTSSSDDGSESSTTAPGEPGPDIRVVYELDGRNSGGALRMTDVVDGVASDPLTVLEAAGNTVYLRVGDRWLVVSPIGDAPVTAIDLASAPPLVAVELEPSDSAGDVSFEASTAAPDRWLVRTSYASGDDLHTLAVDDQGPATPWHVDAGLPATTRLRDGVFVQGGTQVAFVVRDEVADTIGIWLGPASEADPALAPIVEQDGSDLGAPVAPRDGEWLVYTTDGSPEAQRAWFVDLETTPALPVELALLPGRQVHLTPRIAPDGSGLVVRQRVEDGPTDLAWYAVDNGVASPPVQLSIGEAAGSNPLSVTWSPDARWLSFSPDEEPRVLYLVGFDDGVPGEPIAVGESDVELDGEPVFASDGRHAYAFEAGDQQGRIVRMALDGDAPGELQAVSPVLQQHRQFIVSDDARTVCWIGSESADGGEVWCADVSGDMPGAPVRVDVDLARGETIFSGRLDADASHVLLSVDIGDGRKAVLVDRTNGAQHVLEDGAAVSVIAAMFALR